jgi:hypothetical protein
MRDKDLIVELEKLAKLIGQHILLPDKSYHGDFLAKLDVLENAVHCLKILNIHFDNKISFEMRD